jgi:hypothetical protein
MYVRVFIEVSTYMCMSICVYTIFIKNIFFTRRNINKKPRIAWICGKCWAFVGTRCMFIRDILQVLLSFFINELGCWID